MRHFPADENQQPQRTTTPGRLTPKDVFDSVKSEPEVTKPHAGNQQVGQDHAEATRMGAAETLATLGTRPVNATPPAQRSPPGHGLPTAPTPIAPSRMPRQGRPTPNATRTPHVARTPRTNDTTPWPPTSAQTHYTGPPPGTVLHAVYNQLNDQAAQARQGQPGIVRVTPNHAQRPGQPNTAERYTILVSDQPNTTRPTHQTQTNRTPARVYYTQSTSNTPNAHFDDEGYVSGVEDDSPLARMEAMDVETEQRVAVDPRTRNMMPPSAVTRPTNRRMTLSNPRPRPYPTHGPQATPGAAIKRGTGEGAATGPMHASTSFPELSTQDRPDATAYPKMADIGKGRPSQQEQQQLQKVSAEFAQKWGVRPSVLEPAPPPQLEEPAEFENVQVGFNTLQTMRVRRQNNQGQNAHPGPTGTMPTGEVVPSSHIEIGLDGKAWSSFLPRVHAPQIHVPATPGAVHGAAEQLARATLAATPRGPPRPPTVPVPTPGNFGDAILGPAQQALRDIEADPDSVNFADPEHVS